MTAADGLFVALAEALGEPLATTDRALARAARNVGVDVDGLV
jgi:predicted nucleic acid-binding protein